ncbi:MULTISPECIES: hypothetical protein [unclassified Burkholderia]|uniref:hypothetical protein n=1 Tax=unclassified Burkholderia TaxID=2613784 RepID=UPI002ABD9CB0|nr:MULTISPECIES: hypothetical protein [unclassified Burkholderia]
MKHRNDIRFATTGPASCRTGRLRAPGTQAGIASVVRVATVLCVVARRSLPLRVVQRLLRLAMPVAVIAIAIAMAALSAGTSAIAATAAALAYAIAARAAACAARRIAHARAAPAASSPARHRPFSSVRLTLMQDPSS